MNDNCCGQVSSCQYIFKNRNELEVTAAVTPFPAHHSKSSFQVHIYDTSEITIPDRTSSWDAPIYVRPVEYIRSRQRWDSDQQVSQRSLCMVLLI